VIEHVPATRALLHRIDRLKFDGNRCDDMRYWLSAAGDLTDPEFRNCFLDELMEITESSTRWIVIVHGGVRL
jgi:hypothetical protein